MKKIDVPSRYKLPKEVKFCKRCVISNQRPRIVFDDEGICNACRYTDYKETINWKPKISLEEGLVKTFFWYKKRIKKN